MSETFRFTATRTDGRWLLTCPELPGLIRVVSLTSAHTRARAALAAELCSEPGDVVVVPELPEEAVWQFERAADWQEEIDELAERARQAAAEGVQMLLAESLSRREIALALGISITRVRELAKGPTEERGPLRNGPGGILRSMG